MLYFLLCDLEEKLKRIDRCEKDNWRRSKWVDRIAASERHVCKRMQNELFEHQTKRKMSRAFSHLYSTTLLQHPTSVFVLQNPSAAGFSHTKKIMATNVKSKIWIRFEKFRILQDTGLNLHIFLNELHKFSCALNLNYNGF